jgi:hypothetical protein
VNLAPNAIFFGLIGYARSVTSDQGRRCGNGPRIARAEENEMSLAKLTAALLASVAMTAAAQAQSAEPGYTPPKTSWGAPDLQGF